MAGSTYFAMRNRTIFSRLWRWSTPVVYPATQLFQVIEGKALLPIHNTLILQSG
jgi:hypothetical protein